MDKENHYKENNAGQCQSVKESIIEKIHLCPAMVHVLDKSCNCMGLHCGDILILAQDEIFGFRNKPDNGDLVFLDIENRSKGLYKCYSMGGEFERYAAQDKFVFVNQDNESIVLTVKEIKKYAYDGKYKKVEFIFSSPHWLEDENSTADNELMEEAENAIYDAKREGV